MLFLSAVELVRDSRLRMSFPFFAYVPADVTVFQLSNLRIWMSGDVLLLVKFFSKYSSELHVLSCHNEGASGLGCILECIVFWVAEDNQNKWKKSYAKSNSNKPPQVQEKVVDKDAFEKF